MKKIYSIVLIFMVPFFIENGLAQENTPVAGKQFRIANASGLYLTCNPNWNDGGNPWFLDSLYNSTVIERKLVFNLNDTEDTIVVNSDPSMQVFTLVNPDPNDPDVFAIEAANGEYMSQNTEYLWDVTLHNSLDMQESQFYFIDQGFDLYLIQMLTRANEDIYLAADNVTEGLIQGQWDDGWQYITRSYIYNDKPSTQENESAYWVFELTNVTGVADVEVNNLYIYPTLVKDILNVQTSPQTEISIYNISGSLIRKFVLFDKQINVSDLNRGIYFITDSRGASAKFFKD